MATPPSQRQAFGVIRHQQVELELECCGGSVRGADPAPESSSPGRREIGGICRSDKTCAGRVWPLNRSRITGTVSPV